MVMVFSLSFGVLVVLVLQVRDWGRMDTSEGTLLTVRTKNRPS
jgi:hypothetical protein